MVYFWKMNTEHSVLRIMMDEQLHVSSSLIMLASNEGSQLITLIRMAYGASIQNISKAETLYNSWFTMVSSVNVFGDC